MHPIFATGKGPYLFGSADSASVLLEDGLHCNGVNLPVQPAGPRSRVVYVRDCPVQVSDLSVRKLLAPYGDVRKVIQVPHNNFPQISSGTRKVTMSVVKEIPLILRLMGFDCRVWYAGQPSVCPIYRKSRHRAKQCPHHEKCRRCHKPRHVARQCRRACGAASAVPLGPNTSAVHASSDRVPAPVVQPGVETAHPADSCSKSKATLMSGDFEVATSAGSGPFSPRRTRSKGEARPPTHPPPQGLTGLRESSAVLPLLLRVSLLQ